MEFLFFMLFLAFVFTAIGRDWIKAKAPRRESARQSDVGGHDDYPSSWKVYERAERGGGIKDEPDPSKLSYEGAAQPSLGDNIQRFKTTAKTNKSADPFSMNQPPLVRDMNIQRRLFLPGGRNNTFGEREKKRFGSKTLLGFVSFTFIVLYLMGGVGG